MSDQLLRAAAVRVLRTDGTTLKEICSALGYASGSSANVDSFINGRCRDVGGRTARLFATFPTLQARATAAVVVPASPPPPPAAAVVAAAAPEASQPPSTRKRNPWNEFRSNNKGRGWTMEQMRAAYYASRGGVSLESLSPVTSMGGSPFSSFTSATPTVAAAAVTAVGPEIDFRHPAPVNASIVLSAVRAMPNAASVEFHEQATLTLGDIVPLVRLFASLSSLHLTSCEQLDDAAIPVLTSLTQLQVLDISATALTCLVTDDNTGLFPELVALIASDTLFGPGSLTGLPHLPKLATLSLDGCHDIPEAHFDVLGRCAHLEKLSLDSTSADDDSITEIAKGCPGLQQLSIQFCAEVDGKSFKNLAAHSRKLKTLHIKHCQTVRAEHVSALRSQRPDVAVITEYK